MTLDVHRNFIFVKPIVEETKLILPPIFKSKMDTVKRGIVRACGPQSHVNEGETIVFDKWQDNTVLINGEQLIIIQPNSVIAVEA